MTITRSAAAPRPVLRVGVGEFGNAEIDQFRRAVIGDDDIARLYVAVDHQIAVGERHAVTGSVEEF